MLLSALLYVILKAIIKKKWFIRHYKFSTYLLNKRVKKSKI